MLPLVLIGGTLCDDRLWGPLLTGWGRHALTITAGCLPDGDSSTTMSDHAAALLGQLPPRASLVGFSLGGLIALELVAQAPERFDRLGLLCAGAGPETPEGAVARRAGEAAAAEKGIAAHLLRDLIPRYALQNAEGASAETLIAMAQTLGLSTYRRQNDLAISRVDSRPRLRRIDLPVLLLSGEADPLCPPARHRDITPDFPDAVCRTIAACGHMIPLEKPESLRREIIELLAR